MILAAHCSSRRDASKCVYVDHKIAIQILNSGQEHVRSRAEQVGNIVYHPMRFCDQNTLETFPALYEHFTKVRDEIEFDLI